MEHISSSIALPSPEFNGAINPNFMDGARLRNPLYTKIAAVLIGSSVISGYGVGVDKVMDFIDVQRQADIWFDQGYTGLPAQVESNGTNINGEPCAVPPQESVNGVNVLFDTPRSSEPDDINLNQDNTDSSKVYEQYAAVKDAQNQRAAAKNGLGPVPNSRPLADAMNPNKNNETDSFAEQFQIAKEFMAVNYGVDVSIGNDETYQRNGIELLTEARFDSHPDTSAIRSLLQAYEAVPREFVELTGLKSIQLVGGASSAVAGFALKDTIVVNADMNLLPNVYRHEMFHLLDRVLCANNNNAMNDPGFTALTNGPAVVTTDPYKSALVSENGSYNNLELALSQTRFDAIENGDTATLCQKEAQLNDAASKVDTFSDYHTNVVEDKAETGMNMYNTEYLESMLNPRFPIVAAKFRYLAARLFSADSRLVGYIAELGIPDTDSSATYKGSDPDATSPICKLNN